MRQSTLCSLLVISFLLPSAGRAQIEFIDDYATAANSEDIFWKGLPARWMSDFQNFCASVQSHPFSKRYLAVTDKIFRQYYVAKDPSRAIFAGGGYEIEKVGPSTFKPRFTSGAKDTPFIWGANSQSMYDDGNIRFTLDMPLGASHAAPWQTPTKTLLRDWLTKAFRTKYAEAERLNLEMKRVLQEINSANSQGVKIDLDDIKALPEPLRQKLAFLEEKGLFTSKKVNGARFFETSAEANKTIQMIAWCANELRGTEGFRLATMSGPDYAQHVGGCAGPDQLLCGDLKFELCQETLTANGVGSECQHLDWRKERSFSGGRLISGSTETKHNFLFGGLLGVFALGGEEVLNTYGNQVLDLWEKRLAQFEAEAVGNHADSATESEIVLVYKAKRVVEECHKATRRTIGMRGSGEFLKAAVFDEHFVSDRALQSTRFRWEKFASARSIAAYDESLLRHQWPLTATRIAVLGTAARPYSDDDIALCEGAASEFSRLTRRRR